MLAGLLPGTLPVGFRTRAPFADGVAEPLGRLSPEDNEADAPWEELLPHLSGTLELVLVGPFLADASWSQEGDLSPEELKPLDVAVAFNSGMIYYKEWQKALPTLHGC
eukprot:s2340_g8.t1